MLWGVSACGYHFGAPDDALRHERAALRLVDNQTAEPELADACAASLRDRLRATGLTLTDDPDAPLQIEGVVVAVDEHTVAFGDTRADRSIQAEIEVRVHLFATRPERAELAVRDVPGIAAYTRAGDPMQIIARRQAALREACGEAMANATLQLTDTLQGGDTHGQGQ